MTDYNALLRLFSVFTASVLKIAVSIDSQSSERESWIATTRRRVPPSRRHSREPQLRPKRSKVINEDGLRNRLGRWMMETGDWRLETGASRKGLILILSKTLCAPEAGTNPTTLRSRNTDTTKRSMDTPNSQIPTTHGDIKSLRQMGTVICCSVSSLAVAALKRLHAHGKETQMRLFSTHAININSDSFPKADFSLKRMECAMAVEMTGQGGLSILVVLNLSTGF
ncbi:hypothetical protein H6P81_013218 [Aristolochia fimbriata]|uniref:Uncharacterized protein n=1 Tax=Aristolochia fimbriata TaxID=158543 RepID=A0AAV7EE36_ARIFI|nr:hypothetical protein H6P81_013218 [Aristolochia fimbriata]